MQVTYRNTADDWMVFAWHEGQRTKQVPRWNSPGGIIILMLAPLMFLCGGLWLLDNHFQPDSFSLAMGLVSIVTGFLGICRQPLLRWLGKWWFRRYAIRLARAGEFETVKLVFSDDALIEITPGKRAEYQWWALVRIEQLNDHTFIYVTTATALILPKRAFASEEEYQRFVDFARTTMHKVKSSASVVEAVE